MESLEIENPEKARRELLRLADETPGAWMGLKIAALLLNIEGQRPGWTADVLNLSRMSLTRWIHGINERGVEILKEPVRPGRAPRMTKTVERTVESHLKQVPSDFGLNRVKWDGPTLAQHVQRHFGVTLGTRQAQKWLHRHGYGLKRASYSYVQARKEPAQRFRAHIKKTPIAAEE